MNTNRPSILCVEDNPDALNLMLSMLSVKFSNLNIYSALDGESGFRLFKENNPIIVITDLSMQGMDGFELANNIKKLEPQAFIIGVSAHSRSGYDIKSKLQFDCYLHKPVNFVELSNVIQKVIDIKTLSNLQR
ncbi:response regulator [Geobacter pelophilus]|jgi:CheY-like chemotaxis protein|uniref:Response regulator n=1 Tax=Geoanaerobacter pelophilus TaxID=60036 RepID=A0AAW4LHH1_9BACT|nr:response regulator [Geoanaerobacter pelophilus]MBT0666596.1 response regulator [Geoanaerobacter pelophilus]